MLAMKAPDSPGLTATSEEDDSKESSSMCHSNGVAHSLVPACISSQISTGPGSIYHRQTRENVLHRLSEALLRRSLVKVRAHTLRSSFITFDTIFVAAQDLAVVAFLLK